MDLIEGYLAGDHDSFEEIVLSYRKDAEAFAYKLLFDRYAAQDVVQDAFVSLYLQRSKYNKKYALKTYLFTIVRRRCIDYIRKQSRVYLTDDFIIETHESPETVLLHKEKKENIIKAFNEIKKPYQMAIYLVDSEALSYKEAARIMDMSLSGFKVTLMRARKRLKVQLEGVL